MGKKSRLKRLNPSVAEKGRGVNGNDAPSFFDKKDPLLILFLILSIWMIYAQTFRFDFVYDDAQYITLNPHVLKGFTFEGLRWAFTSGYAYNWHPLTWISHMADCEFFGAMPGYHHMVNTFIHMINSALLYLVMKRLFKDVYASFTVAALFALHPLNVESVAWIAERKNLLCLFFFLLTLYQYALYADRPSPARSAWVLSFFAAGLLAKPMIVTLPFLLLLLDIWPLNRAGYFQETREGQFKERVSIQSLMIEKIPFFILSLLSSVVTLLVQKSGGAVRPFDDLPMGVRIMNAGIAYATYIIKLFIPIDLCVLYPLKSGFSGIEISGAFSFLAVCFVGAFLLVKKKPYVTLGWLWYVGTLVPMIGIIQVGNQSMADRYAYLPHIGLFIIIGLVVSSLCEGRRYAAHLRAAFVLILALPLMILSHRQTAVWKDNISLYEHAIAVTENNSAIHNNLGQALYVKGDVENAMKHWKRALSIHPDATTYFNIGNALDDMKRYEEALRYYQKALELNPSYVEVHNNLGITYINLNQLDKSIYHLKKALSLEPGSIQAASNLKKIEDYLKKNPEGKVGGQ